VPERAAFSGSFWIFPLLFRKTGELTADFAARRFDRAIRSWPVCACQGHTVPEVWRLRLQRENQVFMANDDVRPIALRAAGLNI
jgi:hypothetical protein